ncbi:MAG TPA: hypothetical protein VMA31_15290 [Bryobacteraceae bacterium]|nr:hypothetical protein [Bryobacteraceae bacterium]
MLPIALLFLLAAPRVQLVDDVYHVPADDWRYVDFSLKQRVALVTAECEAGSEATPVRIALLRREDLARLRAGEPHGMLDVTRPGAHNRLHYLVNEPGDYALVIDNEGASAATVHLAIWLDFGVQPPAVTQISPGRRVSVILISFAIFLAIAGFSTRRLLAAFRTQSEPAGGVRQADQDGGPGA